MAKKKKTNKNNKKEDKQTTLFEQQDIQDNPKQDTQKALKQETKKNPKNEKGEKNKTSEKTKAKSQQETKSQPKKQTKQKFATAESLAKKQREISVSEFFAKNRHLLGFDNPRKALLTTIKEAVDNSLDACEEAGILPEIEVTIKQISEDRYRVSVEDNGPGIIKSQIPHIFGRLLYGSKFHTLKMSRGQQGIGISAAGMYGMLTTGQPVRVTSRTSPRKPAHYYELQIDTKRNRPDIIKDEEVEFPRDRGTRVTIELQARYLKGKTSVDEYLRQTAIANPHVHLKYITPDGQLIEFPRVSEELPRQGKAIKPHPYGVELGILIKMLKETDQRRLLGFLTHSFSRVSPKVAKEIIAEAKLSEKASPSRIGRTEADRLYRAINKVKILSPPTDCVVPIGEENLLRGLQSIINADFFTAVTRPPAVYRGNPFIIEAALAYGKPEKNNVSEDEFVLSSAEHPQMEVGEGGELVRLMRFANRVPLLYQQSACATYKAMITTNWRNYHLSQSRGALPSGPAVVMIHIASVWVPFTSESKEAIAHYPEIIKEIKLAIQECGRKLARYLSREKRKADELKKRSYIEKYIPHIGIALRDILQLPDNKVEKINKELKGILERSRKL